MTLTEKQAHLAFLKDSLKRSEREAKGWRRLGFPQELLNMHKEDDDRLRKMIAELEEEIKSEQAV